MKPQVIKLSLWAVAIVATPTLALNWWEWQRVLAHLTPMNWELRAWIGFALSAINVAVITAVGVDRGWFNKDAKK